MSRKRHFLMGGIALTLGMAVAGVVVANAGDRTAQPPGATASTDGVRAQRVDLASAPDTRQVKIELKNHGGFVAGACVTDTNTCSGDINVLQSPTVLTVTVPANKASLNVNGFVRSGFAFKNTPQLAETVNLDSSDEYCLRFDGDYFFKDDFEFKHVTNCSDM